MAFEDVLCKYVGEFGRYQIIIMAVISIFVLTDSFDTIEIVYTQASLAYVVSSHRYNGYFSPTVQNLDVTHDRVMFITLIN